MYTPRDSLVVSVCNISSVTQKKNDALTATSDNKTVTAITIFNSCRVKSKFNINFRNLNQRLDFYY